MKAGESLQLPPLTVQAECALRLSFADGGAPCSAKSQAIEIDIATSRRNRSLLRTTVQATGATTESEIQTVQISLPASSSEPVTLLVRCLGDAPHAEAAGSVVLLEVVAGRADELDLLAARTFRQLRIANERQYFGQEAYEHPMYIARRARTVLGIDALIPSERSFNIPGAVENAFDYALALLCRRLRHKAPNFELRLREIAERRGRLAVLSVGTGQGQVEAALLRAIQYPVELTVVDVNDELLRRAAAIMPPNVVTRAVVADANSLPELSPDYDVAVCVSGVHHLVELREFFRTMRDALRDAGELWLIGEQVGPSGNRLDPEALARANDLFMRLPERLRLNFHTGEIDAILRNPDHSEATFEGIRSDAIETEIARYFAPTHVSRRDCILWRMVWPEYVNNYSLQREEDVEILDWLVEEEIRYYLAGGRPTELHGVYAPLRRSAPDGLRNVAACVGRLSPSLT